jgi:hypothetical protein
MNTCFEDLWARKCSSRSFAQISEIFVGLDTGGRFKGREGVGYRVWRIANSHACGGVND